MGNGITANDFAPKGNISGELVDLSAGDRWAESPLFAPGMDKDHEHLVRWDKDVTLAGILRGIRTTKAQAASDRRDYAVFETEDGKLFRCYTPGQLKYHLTEAGINTYVEMTYLGREYVEAHKKELHQFSVKAKLITN